MKPVVTWQSPRGYRINVCKECENNLAGNWPKDAFGEEYCSVFIALHRGTCDVCERPKYDKQKVVRLP